MIFKIMRSLLSSSTSISLTFCSFSAFYENIHKFFDNYRKHKNDHQNERNCPTKLVYYLNLRTTLEFESLKKFWFVFLTMIGLIHDKSFGFIVIIFVCTFLFIYLFLFWISAKRIQINLKKCIERNFYFAWS